MEQERKAKAPEIRDATVEWFIDARETHKGRLQIKMSRSKYLKVYSEWLNQQLESIPEEQRLKFSKYLIQDWMKEYNVSLRKPHKLYTIRKEDQAEGIEKSFGW